MARKIFVTIASGGHDTDKHYNDTIHTLRTATEIKTIIGTSEVGQLINYIHGRPFAAWGAIPGPGNDRTWNTMERGDYVIVYKNKKIIAAAEVALKVRNPNLARYFWGVESDGKTWELIYLLTNLVEIDVPQKSLNAYLGYKEEFTFRGFMAIDQQKVDRLLSTYGDLLSVLRKLETGQTLEPIGVKELEYKASMNDEIQEKIKRAPTEHDEMQWRLINLGNKAKLDVWLPPNDQGKAYNGNIFKEHIIESFGEAVDIPSYIKNIDTVWKLGLSVKAAFEVENSTSIYSGILRLSDLRALAPNSNYPLFIVADRSKRNRVFEQLKRPTFSNDYLALDKVIKYLSYDKVRELDNAANTSNIYNIDWLDDAGESPD